MARRTHRRLQGLATCALALAALAPPASAPAQTACPGATPACPYTSSSQIGQRAGGVLRFPQSVAIGPDGSVYVADQSSSVVQVFGPDGALRREVGRAGTRPGELTSVGAIAVAADNTLFVADGNNRIDRFDADGSLDQLVRQARHRRRRVQLRQGRRQRRPGRRRPRRRPATSCSSPTASTTASSASTSTARALPRSSRPGCSSNPRGLAVRGQRLIVADDKHHRLVVMDFGGRVIRTVGSGQGAGANQFSFPFGVAVDPQGRVFVADDINQRVLRFGPQPDYKYKARWGSYGTGPGQLAYPRAIASDAGGALYVTNTGNDRIDVFDRGGRLLRSWGKSGRGPGQFNAPLGVAADASGMRAVADSTNGRVELLNPDGSRRLVVGLPLPRPDDPAPARRRRLRRRRRRLRARPAPRADLRLRPRHRPAGAHDRQPGQRAGAADRPVGDRDRRDRRHHRRRHRQPAHRALQHRRRPTSARGPAPAGCAASP